MKKLIQANDNAQVNGVTAGEVALCKTLNENAQELGTLGSVDNGVQEGKTSLQRVYETLEDNGNTYTNVRVEGVTPNRMKNLLNTQIKKAKPDSAEVTFQTPGEPIVVNNGVDGTEDRDGVVQIYNKAIIDSSVTGIRLDLTPDLREGEANVEANATIGTVSVQGTSDEVVISLDEVGDYASFNLEDKTLKVGDSPLTAKEYKVTLSAVASDVEDVISKEFTITVAEAYPEITSFSISPTGGLEEGNANVQANAVVTTMSVEGGSAPITYSFKEDAVNGADNSSFVIDGANLKVGGTPLVTKEYKVSLTATDTHSKTKDQTATISVAAPEITTLTVSPVSDLNAPLTVDTVVANLSAEGGIAPYTYTLKAETGDNAEFKIDGTTVKVGTQIDSAGNKNITVVVTDKNNKTKEQTAEIVIGAQE